MVTNIISGQLVALFFWGGFRDSGKPMNALFLTLCIPKLLKLMQRNSQLLFKHILFGNLTIANFGNVGSCVFQTLRNIRFSKV